MPGNDLGIGLRYGIGCSLVFALMSGCADGLVPLDPPPGGGTGQTDYATGGHGGEMVLPLPKGGTSGGIAVEPRSLDFGGVAVGFQSVQTLTIRNTGSTPFTGLNLLFGTNATQFGAASDCPFPLLPGTTCSVSIWFTPSVPGTVNTTLTVSSQDASVVVMLSGSTVGAPAIAISPSSHAFGEVVLNGANLPSRQFTVTATGGMPGTYTGTLSITMPPGFKVEKDDCTGRSLPRNGGACSFLVLPDGRPGTFSGALRVTQAQGAEVLATLTMTANILISDPFGLIGYWKFDERFGTLVSDSSGNGNHGTVRQGATSSAPLHSAPEWGIGKRGGALRMDGLDDWVSVPDSDSIDSTGVNNAVSISAWIKLDRYNTLRPYNVVAQRNTLARTAREFFLGLSSGKPAVGINYFYGVGVSNVPLNEWVHMAMTYDGITQCVYVNGIMSVCQDVGWPIAANATSFTMGAGIAEEDVTEHMAGLIDEVQLHNAVLTQAEVEGLYRAQ